MAKRHSFDPHQVPGRFWDERDVQEALVRCDLGAFLGLYWQRTPASQTDIAACIGRTQPEVWRIIKTDRQVLTLNLLTDIADGLGMPDRARMLLGLAPADMRVGATDQIWLSRGRRTQSKGDEGQSDASWIGEGEAQPVRRDEFLRLAGTTLGALLVPPLIHDWLDSAGRGTDGLDDVVVDRLRAQTAGYRWLDRQEGAHRHLAGTARHARHLVSLWQRAEHGHPLRPALAELAADACHLVAYQAFDQGDRGLAIEWYRSAADLAARSGNRELYVFAVCGAAYMHAKNSAVSWASSLLEQTRRLRMSAAAECYVSAYEAHTMVAARDEDASLAALDHAARLADTIMNDPPSSWLGIPDAVWVQRQRAAVLAQLGRPEAIELLADLQRRTPHVFRRFRVTAVTDLAQVHARVGDVAQSAELLTSALAMNKTTRSVEREQRIRAVRALLAPFGGCPAITRVDEALVEAGRLKPDAGQVGLEQTRISPRADEGAGRDSLG